MQQPPLQQGDLGLIGEPVLPQSDRIARKELDILYNEKRRKERVKNAINWCFVIFLIIASTIATIGIAVRLIHLVLPTEWAWLNAEQIQGIDKLFFSGAVGGLLASYFKKSNE